MADHEVSTGVNDPDDVAEIYRKAFPPGSGDLFFSLWNDVVFLHLDWATYRSLFGTSQERFDTLNWAAGQFFNTVYRVLWNDIIMRIARLTDPATSGRGRDNASLQGLLKKLEGKVPPNVATDWEVDLSSLRSAAGRIRVLRDKTLAHADLKTALHYDENPLPGISRADIEGLLLAIRKLMNAVERHFRDVSMHFEWSIPALGDAESLIAVLERAQRGSGARTPGTLQALG